MLYYKRKQRKHFKLKCIILTVIALIILIIAYCEYQLSILTPNYIQNQAEIIANNSVCKAVNHTIETLNYTYDDLAKLKYSDSGNVLAIETDSPKINRIKSEVTKAVEDEISKIYECELKIPIGCFTDITLLSNSGPEISINLNITGSFSCRIESTFDSAAINQTVHHIKLILTSNIIAASLDYSDKITFTTDFEIAQSVIVGTVPSGYGALYRTY